MTRLRPLLLLALVVFGLAACTDPVTNDPPGQGPLEGVIVGTLTDPDGKLTPGQQIALAKTSNLTPASLQAQAANVTTTDEHGRFAFDVTESGTYTLTTRTDSTGALARVNVTREADGGLTAGEVKLQATELGAVTGTVANQGAGVMAYLAGTSFLALTDDDGDYAITRVPAGTYQARAILNGVSSPGVTVTVQPGKTTALTTALQLAPSITRVTPAGLVGVVSYEAGWPEFVIEGSGFGATQGASALNYFGIEVPRHAITRWSDTQITVNMRTLAGWFDDALDEYLYDVSPFALDELRFRIETPGGAATSQVTGYYSIYLHFGSPPSYRARVHVLDFDAVAGLGLEVAVINGSAVDENGAPVTTASSGGSNDYGPDFYVQPSSSLPVIAQVTVDHPLFIPRTAAAGHYQRATLQLDENFFPRDGEPITGRIQGHDGTPLPDYSHFTFRYRGFAGAEATPAVAADGSFTLDLPVPSGFSGSSLILELLYHGVDQTEKGLSRR